MPLLVVPDVWEVPHSCVKVGKLLGHGAFGEVLKGRISRSILQHRKVKLPSESSGDGTHISVAVKMLKGRQFIFETSSNYCSLVDNYNKSFLFVFF